MFIYKITNAENNLCYIGFDTHAEYLQHRWSAHRRNCALKDTKFYTALRKDIGKFSYEVIDRAEKIVDLVFKEIYWIDYYNSYKNGYNSTRGGDGLNQDLSQFSEIEIQQLKQLYSMTMTNYNHNIKWKDRTTEERKELTSHLHNASIYKKKSESLKQYYKDNPAAIEEKRSRMRLSRNTNKQVRDEQARIASMIGAEKVSKKVKVQFQDGTIKIFNSKSAFVREYDHSINRTIAKTQQGKTHNGRQAWEI